MKFFKINSRLCSIVFLFTCLFFCGILAWKIGEANAIESVWVAREKIVGAEPYTTVEQVNIGRGLLYGIPTFLISSLFSVTLTELYFSALSHFRGES